jgi:PEP-CTERM motif-containing protein
MSNRSNGSRQDTIERLVAYSAAAGLGAFAFGQEAGALIVHTDIPDLVINRGDDALNIDFDNDGYVDVSLIHGAGGGFGYGNVMWRGSLEYAGLPGSDPLYPNRGTGYSITNTLSGNAYYVRSFDSGDIIGSGNPFAVDITPNGSGHFYGLVSNYGSYGGDAFWDPSAGFPRNEYAGVRFVDSNGDNRFGWARFQITIHDVVNANGLPFPDGIIDERDYQSDAGRFVTVFEYAYETTPDLDILAGDVGSPSFPGDLDGDGFVGILDLNIVLAAWNQSVPSGNPLADPSGDGFVGIEDLNTVLGDWNKGTAPASGAAVPEPTSLAILAAGGGALAFTRRQRRR